MKLSKPTAIVVALTFFIVLTSCSETFSQDSNAYLTKVPSGKKFKIQGIVIRRKADKFRVRDIKMIETDVALTDSTKVRTHHNGIFRGGTTYAAGNVLRGLRVQVEGVGNDEGQLVARLIKFDERDLRTAQALQATVDPVEELAESNQERITATEKNAEKLSGQIEENTALANAAMSTATRARVTADGALKSATLANERIGGLGFYDTVKIITVYFESGSSVLDQEARDVMDRETTWAEIQKSKGYVVEVVGFADSTGTVGFNKQLSERRTKAVIDYLVLNHSLPLQRLIRPFGYGSDKPAADNDSSDGRAKNRRVEISVLVNRGIAGTIN
jgi:OmpA-OmpF porin, OOP family